MFEWLKDIFYEKEHTSNKPKLPKSKPKLNLEIKNYTKDTNYIKIDSRKYLIINLTPNGFVCEGADDTIAIGIHLNVNVIIRDQYGNFTFPTKIEIKEIDSKHQFKADFILLLPEIETVLIKYYKLRNVKK